MWYPWGKWAHRIPLYSSSAFPKPVVTFNSHCFISTPTDFHKYKLFICYNLWRPWALALVSLTVSLALTLKMFGDLELRDSLSGKKEIGSLTLPWGKKARVFPPDRTKPVGSHRLLSLNWVSEQRKDEPVQCPCGLSEPDPLSVPEGMGVFLGQLCVPLLFPPLPNLNEGADAFHEIQVCFINKKQIVWILTFAIIFQLHHNPSVDPQPFT